MNKAIRTTNYFRQAAAASAMFAGLLALTGCDDGPECLDYDTQVVPTTTFVNGKVVTGTTVVTTCTRYAEPTAGQ
ncbi:hypothetical protein ACFW6C_07385 [Streptomyces fungicidicus]|uniref:hypothetical protein n=1 Tax=Streptomyces fungicidicus TaxID=68203 RepID=UPI0036993751